MQQCVGIRPDVLPINTAMAKGVWFKPVQSHNYPNVTFPGKTATLLVKNPNQTFSYSTQTLSSEVVLEKFFDSQIRESQISQAYYESFNLTLEKLSNARLVNPKVPTHTLKPTPYTLHTTPYTLHTTPYNLQPTTYNLEPAP